MSNVKMTGCLELKAEAKLKNVNKNKISPINTNNNNKNFAKSVESLQNNNNNNNNNNNTDNKNIKIKKLLTPMPPPKNSHHTKLKRSIIGGTLIALVIIGWHLYEHFFYEKSQSDPETVVEHEIHELTQKLYNDEMQHNSFLTKVYFQGKVKSYGRDDHAPRPLLVVDENALTADKTSTSYLLTRLFDNYELDTHTVEHVTDEEKQEELDLLHAILKTPIMKRAMRFLQAKGVITSDYEKQLQLLKDIWFTQYSRGQGRVGSSGFEHVFLAEMNNNNILGLHNWIYFHFQEQKGNIDYKGIIDRIDLGKDNQHLLAVRFTFHDVIKPYNTLLIGTSPELEMSLYTVCFLLSAGAPCPVQLGSSQFNIITHVWDWHGKKTLATAYPSIE